MGLDAGMPSYYSLWFLVFLGETTVSCILQSSSPINIPSRPLPILPSVHSLCHGAFRSSVGSRPFLARWPSSSDVQPKFDLLATQVVYAQATEQPTQRERWLLGSLCQPQHSFHSPLPLVHVHHIVPLLR